MWGMQKKVDYVDLFNIIGGRWGGWWSVKMSGFQIMTDAAGSRASILRTGEGSRQSNSRVSFSQSRRDQSSFLHSSRSRQSSSKKQQSSNGETTSSLTQEEAIYIISYDLQVVKLDCVAGMYELIVRQEIVHRKKIKASILHSFLPVLFIIILIVIIIIIIIVIVIIVIIIINNWISSSL